MMKEITSVHNAAAQLLRELQKPRARREHGLFVCESAKMVGEAVALHLAQTLFVEKGREAEYAQMAAQAESMGCALYVVSQAVMQAVSTAKTPQGIVCTAKIPEPPKTLTGKRIVALDGVQDPGNVGTILRTADAAGFDGANLRDRLCGFIWREDASGDDGQCVPRACDDDGESARNAGSHEARRLRRGGYRTRRRGFLRALPARQGNSGHRQRGTGHQRIWSAPRRPTIWLCPCAAARNRSTRRLRPAS